MSGVEQTGRAEFCGKCTCIGFTISSLAALRTASKQIAIALRCRRQIIGTSTANKNATTELMKRLQYLPSLCTHLTSIDARVCRGWAHK